ncbi:hypothetical protein [Pseudomonas veronii]|uniref:hypothetical protein n=1 Tax=Pseudomonas veronii TaxID=76761 RepID=UPI002D78E1A1|nr:hypothetical protein [Pseudomonas veronii]WRU66043.1 hypothetical protein VPH48_32735 [Pseudomonas veronii]
MTDSYIHNQLRIFVTAVSHLSRYKMVSDKIYTAQADTLKKSDALLPEWSSQLSDGTINYFYYQCPSTGGDLSAPPIRLMLKDRLEHNALLQVKTYHWLLAEAYEAFEDFLENVYAYCGLQGLSLWEPPLEGLDSTPTTLEGFLKVRYKKGARTPYRQLEGLRKNSVHFAQRETGVFTGNNYRVGFVLIEKFRHDIVHEGGYTNDLRHRISLIQGLVPQPFRKAIKGYVESYYIEHKGRHLIHLLEIPSEGEHGAPDGSYLDTMTGLFRTLVEYAQLIIDSIVVHIAENERSDVSAEDSGMPE